MSFERALEWLLPIEGGYVNHPSDTGGATNMGVTQAVYDAWRASRGLEPVSVKHLTRNEAAAIYKERYWDRVDGDSRPYAEALAIFDFAVHSGVTRALDYWQRYPDVIAYIDARQRFLTELKGFAHFGKGWMRRLNKLRTVISHEAQRLDTELVVIYAGDKELAFQPAATSLGRTAGGRRKLMVRL